MPCHDGIIYTLIHYIHYIYVYIHYIYSFVFIHIYPMIHDGFQLSLPFLPLTFAIFFVDKRCWLRDNWDRFLSKIQRLLSMCCGLQCLPSILIHGLLTPGRLRQHRFVRKWAAPRSRDIDKIHIERPYFSKQIRVAALNIEQQGENALEKLSGCCLLAPEQ